MLNHDDVIKWKYFPCNWPFGRGIHWSPGNSPHKGQWRGALMFSLIFVWINDWVNNREAGNLRRYRAHYDVIVLSWEAPRSCGRFDNFVILCQFKKTCVYGGDWDARVNAENLVAGSSNTAYRVEAIEGYVYWVVSELMHWSYNHWSWRSNN